MRVVVFFLFGLVTGITQAQKLQAFWQKNPALVGEHLQLDLIVKNPPTTLNYQPVPDIIPCKFRQTGSSIWKEGSELEVLSFQDTLYIQQDGQKIWKGIYTLIAWDSAILKIEDLGVVLNDSLHYFDIPQLKIEFKKEKYQEGLEEIAIIPVSDWWLLFKKYWWIGALLILVFAGLLVVWLSRKKNKSIKLLSLRERTLLAIQELRKREDWKHGKIKNHYSAFSSILKMYLGSRFDLNLMERTTQDTLLLLKMKELHPDTLSKIDLLLRESDLVKFAKVELNEMQVKSSLLYLEELVNELSPLELPNE